MLHNASDLLVYHIRLHIGQSPHQLIKKDEDALMLRRGTAHHYHIYGVLMDFSK